MAPGREGGEGGGKGAVSACVPPLTAPAMPSPSSLASLSNTPIPPKKTPQALPVLYGCTLPTLPSLSLSSYC